MYHSPLRQLLLLALFSSLAGAQPVYQLPDQVVTGTLVPQSQQRSPATQVKRARIKALQPLHLSELLQTIPSLQVLDQGSFGSLSSLQLRGYGSSATLVTVDGRPVNSPSLGGADLAPISVQGLDRIEVVRGPYSALYGPNSMGGVVNLLTAPAGAATPSQFQVMSGSQKTTAASAVISADLDEEVSLLFVPEFRQSSGNRSNAQSTLANGLLKLTAYPDEENKLEVSLGNQNLLLGVPGPQPAADLQFRNSSQVALGNEESSSSRDRQQTRNSWLNLHWQGPQTSLQLSQSNWETVYTGHYLGFDQAPRRLEAQTREYQTLIDLRQRFPQGPSSQFTLGAALNVQSMLSQSFEHHSQTGSVEPSSYGGQRTMQSLYFEEQLLLGSLSATLGVRADQPSDFAGQISPRLALRWELAPELALRGAWGMGYRPPSLSEVNLVSDPFVEGNPNLRPERSQSYEWGVDWFFAPDSHLRLTQFNDFTRDQIVFAPVGSLGPFGPRFTGANLNSSQRRGWEAELAYQIDPKWQVGANYSQVDAVQTNLELVDASSNLLLPQQRPAANVARTRSSLWLGYSDPESLSLMLQGQFLGSRVQYYANYDNYPQVSYDSKRLDPLSLWNLSLTIPLSIEGYRSDLIFKVNNLLDAQGALLFGNDLRDRNYPLAGRSLFFGARFPL